LCPVHPSTEWPKVIVSVPERDGTQSRFDINDLAYCPLSTKGFSGLVVEDDKARAAMRGEGRVLAELAGMLVRPERHNLVERPWGGDWIRRFKRVAARVSASGSPWGEAFEISAFSKDLEAGRFPSRLRFDDGSLLDLPALLEAQGEALLGEPFIRRHGACFPLLPKTLSIKELLSVQGHPTGHTEVYVIIDAEPGATLRLGFSRDVDPLELTRSLTRGIEQQARLLELLGPGVDAAELQAVIAPWLADRGGGRSGLEAWLERGGAGPTAKSAVRSLLDELKAVYWAILDSMNAIEVKPGQVIYNATPERLLAETGAAASAEVHALGNPEGREILALEIRRPGPTFRAWDNVRFPLRDVDVVAAIETLNLRATSPEEFIRERVPIRGREGTFVSVDCEHFRVEHLSPEPGRPVAVPRSHPHSLHCLAGCVEVSAEDGRPIGRLESGESALVPVGVGAYRIEAAEPADVVRVTLPED
jgi:mannose-6-phosphate isomerase class I